MVVHCILFHQRVLDGSSIYPVWFQSGPLQDLGFRVQSEDSSDSSDTSHLAGQSGDHAAQLGVTTDYKDIVSISDAFEKEGGSPLNLPFVHCKSEFQIALKSAKSMVCLSSETRKHGRRMDSPCGFLLILVTSFRNSSHSRWMRARLW